MTTTTAPASTRQPVEMTALQAATRSYAWIAAKPEFAGKAPAEIQKPASELMARMIRSGLFVIVD